MCDIHDCEMRQVEQDYWICEECEDEEEQFTCMCGRNAHKDDLCGHGFAIGICCNCVECEAEWSDEDDEDDEDEEKSPE